MKKGFVGLIWLCCLCMGVACYTPTVPENGQVTLDTTQQKLGAVDAKGGEVCSKGGICFTFPSGAVDAKIELKARIDQASADGVVGRVYDFTATKETFNKDIQLRLPVPAGQEDAELVVAFWKDGAWVEVPTTRSTDGKFRIGQTNHLSRWGLKSKKPAGCQSDADCAAGQVCQSGACTSQNPCKATKEVCGDKIDNDCDGIVDEGCSAGCSSDADCAAGEVCKSGSCTKGPSNCTRSEVCGDGIDNNCDGQVDEGCSTGCSSDADCAAGQICAGGQCKAAPTGCRSDADCAAGEACETRTYTCYKKTTRCSSDADCGRGEVCMSGVCTTPGTCRDGATRKCSGGGVGACIGEQTCANGAWGTCKASSPSKEVCGDGIDNDCDGVVDEGCSSSTRCSSNADCARGQVCGSRGVCQAAPTGCSSDADCARGEVCSSGQCKAASTGCSSDADCAAGQVCASGQCTTAPAGCSSDADCARGEICNSRTLQCEKKSSACTPTKEVCGDGIDNDCDGIVDEGCSSSTRCSSNADCAAGQACMSGYCR